MGDINGDGKLDIAAGNNAANPSSPAGTVTVWNGLWVAAGPHTVRLDRDAGLATGIYFHRIEAEGSRKSGRIVVLDQ